MCFCFQWPLMDHPYEETGLQWDRVPRNKRSKETSPGLARLVCSLYLHNDEQRNAHTCTVNTSLKQGHQSFVESPLKTEAETHITFNSELILWFIKCKKKKKKIVTNAHEAQSDVFRLLFVVQQSKIQRGSFSVINDKEHGHNLTSRKPDKQHFYLNHDVNYFHNPNSCPLFFYLFISIHKSINWLIIVNLL